MLKFLTIFLVLNFYNSALSSPKEKIISKMEQTNNLGFNFTQTIDEKIQKGSCIIEYPKKIFCEYSGKNEKILVSNGNSLVIKTSVSYYLYPLEKTPLNFILDKNYLINKIYNLKERVIDESFINYKINENGSEINIFFDNQSFNMIGWQIKDVYQNLNITFFSSVKKTILKKKDKNLTSVN